jgi:hypothetical protein
LAITRRSPCNDRAFPVFDHAAARIGQLSGHFINGAWQRGNAAPIDVIDPATETVIGRSRPAARRKWTQP